MQIRERQDTREGKKLYAENPYKRTAVTNVQQSFSFVLADILLVLHILLNLPSIANVLHFMTMSFVQRPSSVIKPPRYTKWVSCSSSSLPPVLHYLQFFIFSLTLRSSCCFPKNHCLVFAHLFGVNIYLLGLLVSCNLSVSSCICSGNSTAKSVSSAKRRLLSIRLFRPIATATLAPANCSAKLIIASRSRFNSQCDSSQPCLTPTVIMNHSVSPPSTLTDLL